MTSSSVLSLCLVCGTFLQLSSKVFTVAEGIPPPSASIYLLERSSDNVNTHKVVKDGSPSQQPTRFLLNDIVNTDLEIQPGKEFELECMANYPVQWSYRGHGKPEFTTNVTTDLVNSREVHKASLIIPSAIERDTGLYACGYTEFPEIYSTYHLFVPGTEIFVSQTGRTVNYYTGRQAVTIPCPVSIKDAKVALKKIYFDKSLRNVDPPFAIFDPKKGFKLNIHEIRDPDGVYVCIGSYDGRFRLREFTVRNQDRNESAVTFPDQHGINPCASFACPSRSMCRVNLNTNLPFCACRPKTGSSVTNCTRLCKTTQECPKSEKCFFSKHQQLRMCVSLCQDVNCAENAECFVDEQRGGPKCRCRRGYQGNGNYLCERIPIKSESTSYCTATKCGPHGSCQTLEGRPQCGCKVGSIGRWPDCSPSCTSDEDCSIQDKCTSKGVCEHVCKENLCAPKAECKVLQRQPQCLCPPGYTGKATEACYPSHYYYNSYRGDFETDEVATESSSNGVTEDVAVTIESQEETLNMTMPAEDASSKN
ncbi:EGF, latrophilin seven transmembrane domain-containing protein 1 [Orchesella cincta]|uniref:EGF, latrophilin seven transmembrane domain-containing protein 1 n=1 Tax=Orchesella cincta TaxID=48709 RepID=A0A1D2N446_ORCCI|nr:EGF, latrophilin seven transmembrane domain-containing protein 1 [Orchesella cincta]